MKLLLTARATSSGTSVPPGDVETDQTKINETYTVQAGDIGEITATAMCGENPAEVTITSYNFAEDTVDGAGYRPTLQKATAPTLLHGEVLSSKNGFPVFPLPSPSSQAIGIKGKATGAPCGTWPLDGIVNLVIEPLLPSPKLDISGNTTFGNFNLVPPEQSSKKVWEFNLGKNSTPNQGFRYEQDVTFQQEGWVGVIQLIKGQYSSRTKDGNWEPNIQNLPNYVHDNRNPPDAEPILSKFRVTPGTKVTVRFRDTPGVNDVAAYLEDFPGTVAMQIKASFQTVLMFNPSTSDDPTADPNTIWYPLSAGVIWTIYGEIEWNGKGDSNDLTKWDVTHNQCYKLPYDNGGFPTWNDYLHSPIRGTSVPELSAVEVSSKDS